MELYDNLSPIDFRYYANKEEYAKVKEFLSENAKILYMAKVERVLVKKLAEKQVISKEVYEEIQKACQEITAKEVYEEEQKNKHEVRALVNVIKGKVSDKAKPFVHFTLTSNDVLDTANNLRYKEFTKQLLLPSLLELEKLLIEFSLKEKETLQIGRTHGQHALPLTFGSYISGFVSRLGRRIKKLKYSNKKLVGKLSGAIGNYNALNLFVENPIEFEKEVLEEIGLMQATSSQIVEEEFLLDYLHVLTSILGVIADLSDDFRQLQRSEIAELNEVFEKGQVGSSTMPHKRNPITFENLKGLWKVFMPKMITFYSDQLSEHQRDLTNSITKRFVSETLFAVLYASETLRKVLEKIEVNKEKMKKNLEENKNIIISEALQLLLSFYGHPTAHEVVLELSNKALQENKNIYVLAQQEKELHKYLDKFTVEQKKILEKPETYLGKAVKKTEKICEYWKKELGL